MGKKTTKRSTTKKSKPPQRYRDGRPRYTAVRGQRSIYGMLDEFGQPQFVYDNKKMMVVPNPSFQKRMLKEFSFWPREGEDTCYG